MRIVETQLGGVWIIEPDIHGDNRGQFLETYHRERYNKAGIDIDFVQDNLSFSFHGTLRGLHYQLEPYSQAKLVQVIDGEILDVALDVRVGSPTFGKWVSVLLTVENRRQMLIPRGFAHGFSVKSESAHVLYKCDNYYHPESEWGVLWSDLDCGIDWELESPILSEKDGNFPLLKEIPHKRLPVYREM